MPKRIGKLYHRDGSTSTTKSYAKDEQMSIDGVDLTKFDVPNGIVSLFVYNSNVDKIVLPSTVHVLILVNSTCKEVLLTSMSELNFLDSSDRNIKLVGKDINEIEGVVLGER